MTQEALKKLPAVTATRRTYVISDGLFYDVFADGHREPLAVMRHGVRATNNTPPKKSDEKLQEKDVRNLQTIDTAKTHPQAESVEVEFSLAFLDIALSLDMAAGEHADELRTDFKDYVERAKAGSGLRELADRYARNLLNGRWLFRNRLLAESIQISVSHQDETIATSNALERPFNHFDDYNDAEKSLGAVIHRSLTGAKRQKLLITAQLHFLASGAVEVYPSQNYKDGNDKLSRSLYVANKEAKIRNDEGPALVGQAALRDQKIANALRTIDTWYPDFASEQRPIPIEQYGANLDSLKFYRRGKNTNAFDLLKQLQNLDPNSDAGCFMTACLIRGAVYAG